MINNCVDSECLEIFCIVLTNCVSLLMYFCLKRCLKFVQLDIKKYLLVLESCIFYPLENTLYKFCVFCMKCKYCEMYFVYMCSFLQF